jgi:hypothetical protein
MSRKRTLARLPETDFVYILLILIYVILLILQINQYPLERYPGWDQFWGNTVSAGTLISLKQALANFELPAISPYIGFGWNLGGNHNSFWALPNIFVLFFSPEQVLLLRQILFLFCAALGAFFYLRFVISNKFISFLGGLFYISLPYVISLHYFYPMSFIFYFVPFSLFLIHKLLERKTAKYLIIFVAYWAIAIGSSDIYCFLVFPAVVFTYTFMIAFFYYRHRLPDALKKSSLLLLLCFLSGSFYILPLANNMRTISASFLPLLKMNIYQTEQIRVNFLQFFFTGGFKSILLPIEGSAITLYIPFFFYCAIIGCLLFKKFVFKNNPKNVVLVGGLMVLGLMMFFEALIFYSPLIAKIFPTIAEGAKGILRAHLNLIPFVNILAGFVCIGSLNESKNGAHKIWLYASFFILSLVLDFLLFIEPRLLNSADGLFQMTSKNPYFESSNFLPVNMFRDSWLFLPILNAFLIPLFFFSGIIGKMRRRLWKNSFTLLITIFGMALPLLTLSVYNQLRLQQANWQVTTRNPYRKDNYLRRNACLKALLTDNLNYRILYAGEGLFEVSDGRDLRLIAETELHIADRNKVLFSYREFEEPYTGLLRGTFQTGGKYWRSNIHPPLSDEVKNNLATMKLMGIKYVISAGKKIDHPDLIYKGECISKDGPWNNFGYYEGGSMYVYELSQPLRIAFLVDQYKESNIGQILKMIYGNKEHPWNNNLVYLEMDPSADSQNVGEAENASSEIASIAEIKKETFNSMELDVRSPQDKYLVVSYIYRSNWKAFIDSTPAKIYRAYGGFMCLKVPKGKHRVTFKYSPTDIYAGLSLTALAFLLPLGIKKWF